MIKGAFEGEAAKQVIIVIVVATKYSTKNLIEKKVYSFAEVSENIIF